MEPGTVLRNICQLLLIRKQILSNSRGTSAETYTETAAENKTPNKGKKTHFLTGKLSYFQERKIFQNWSL